MYLEASGQNVHEASVNSIRQMLRTNCDTITCSAVTFTCSDFLPFSSAKKKYSPSTFVENVAPSIAFPVSAFTITALAVTSAFPSKTVNFTFETPSAGIVWTSATIVTGRSSTVPEQPINENRATTARINVFPKFLISCCIYNPRMHPRHTR